MTSMTQVSTGNVIVGWRIIGSGDVHSHYPWRFKASAADCIVPAYGYG